MATLPTLPNFHALAVLGAAPPLLVAANPAFDAVFAVFVVAFVVLVVVTLRWAIRRDRVGRAEWARRQAPRRDARTGAPAAMNGHTPRQQGQKGKKGPQGKRGRQGLPGGGSPET